MKGNLPERYLELAVLSACERTGRILAFDIELQREVTFTWLLPASAAEAQRFQAECRLIRELDVPGLPAALGAGSQDDFVYLVTEARAHPTLRQILGGGRLTLAVAARLAVAIFQALMAMHGRGLVHGALEPGNVLVDAEGRAELDGYAPAPAVLARDLGPAKSNRIRHHGPEVGQVRAVLPSSDLYAFGLLVHELVSGVSLVKPCSANEAVQRAHRLQALLDRPGRAFSYLSPAVERLLRAVLQADPRARPRSALQIADLVDGALSAVADRSERCGELLRALTYPRREVRTQLEVTARRYLREARPLAAATMLRFAADPDVPLRELAPLGKHLMECLWYTLTDRPVLERSVLAYQCYRAAERIVPDPLLVLARRRLAELAHGEEGPAPKVGPELPPARQEQLREALRQGPAQEEFLLTLAVFRPESRPDPQPSLEALKVAVARKLDLPLVALLHAGRRLEREGSSALEGLREVAEEAYKAHGIDAAPDSQQLGGMDDLFGEIFGVELAPYVGEGAVAPRPTSQSGKRLDAVAAAELVDAAGLALASERLPEAATALAKLYDHGAAQVEARYSAICEHLRHFHWLAVRASEPDPELAEALEVVLRVARGLGLHDLVPIAERMLVAAIPETSRAEHVARLLAESPESIPILQAASRLAASRGDRSEWIRHLETAGFTFLEAGEMALASKMFMALRSMEPDSEAARKGMQGVFELGSRTAEADRRLARHRQIYQDRSAAEELAELENLRSRFPAHGPLAVRAAEVFQQLGHTAEAAKLRMQLAKRYLYREEDDRARVELREVLSLDHDNDEAMLHLLVLEPPAPDAPATVWKLKVWLCGREELPHAAIYHARRRLTGGATDLPILDVILSLSQAAGQDRSPVLTEAAFIAWEAGQIELARRYLDSAYRASPDKEALLDSLLARDNIQEIFPRVELLKMRTDPGKALIPDAKPVEVPPTNRIFSSSEPGLVDPG